MAKIQAPPAPGRHVCFAATLSFFVVVLSFSLLTLFVDPGFGKKVLQHEAAFERAMQRRGVPAVVRWHLV